MVVAGARAGAGVPDTPASSFPTAVRSAGRPIVQIFFDMRSVEAAKAVDLARPLWDDTIHV